jgi:hypothetical protein
MITGRLLHSAIARMIGSKKAPAWPDTPISTVGWTLCPTQPDLVGMVQFPTFDYQGPFHFHGWRRGMAGRAHFTDIEA